MPAQKTSFTWTEIKAGLMVMAGVLIFLLFLAGLRGMRMPEKTSHYSTCFKDTLGLNKGADVRFGGAKVGRVAAIGMNPDNPCEIRVDFQVDPAVPINAESEAYVGQVTLTAEKHLEITTGSPKAKRLQEGAQIISKQRDLFGVASQAAAKVGEVLDGVKSILGTDKYAATSEDAAATGREEIVAVPDLLKSVDGAVQDVRGVLEKNRQNIDEIVAGVQDVEQSAKELVDNLNSVIEENREDIHGTLEGAHAAVGSVEESLKQVEVILKDIAKATAGLDDLAATLQSALNNAEGLSAEAQAMIRENRPQIEDLIADIQETILYVKEFSRVLAEQPQSVLRGKKPYGRQDE